MQTTQCTFLGELFVDFALVRHEYDSQHGCEVPDSLHATEASVYTLRPMNVSRLCFEAHSTTRSGYAPPPTSLGHIHYGGTCESIVTTMCDINNNHQFASVLAITVLAMLVGMCTVPICISCASSVLRWYINALLVSLMGTRPQPRRSDYVERTASVYPVRSKRHRVEDDSTAQLIVSGIQLATSYMKNRRKKSNTSGHAPVSTVNSDGGSDSE